MINVENIKVYNFEGAIRGLRNPMNSWSKSDSYWGYDCGACGRVEKEGHCIPKEHDCSKYLGYVIGSNDLDLMKRLFKAGTEHRKYLRQIFVSMDITAPLYWWKEFDTYKVGTVANSCSTMHKLTEKPFEMTDFSCDKLGVEASASLQSTIGMLNRFRQDYLNSKEKFFWWQIIQLLPSSYNQRRTVTMNYENVFTIIKQRSGHKLDEWNKFVEILKTLPYIKEIGEFES